MEEEVGKGLDRREGREWKGEVGKEVDHGPWRIEQDHKEGVGGAGSREGGGS